MNEREGALKLICKQYYIYIPKSKQKKAGRSGLGPPNTGGTRPFPSPLFPPPLQRPTPLPVLISRPLPFFLGSSLSPSYFLLPGMHASSEDSSEEEEFILILMSLI
jgi:hypothetical protein